MGLFSSRRQTTTPPQPPPMIATASQPQFNATPPAYHSIPAYGDVLGGYSQAQNLSQQTASFEQGNYSPGANAITLQRSIDQDAVDEQFSNIIAGIDEDRWNENDDDFSIILSEDAGQSAPRSVETTRAVTQNRAERKRPQPNQRCTQKITIWSKVSFYNNSKLPSDLPPLRVYIPTWPLICLAAQYSANAYKSLNSSMGRDAFVSADPRLGTKAMVINSVPCDDKKTLVFAIRGTSTLSLRDWNVNLQTAPISPAGFLDDEGNLCHAGFLKVAKAMIKPIAMRLRSLLEENPSRASCSLLITGHSAGGAVAALLYSHMLSSIRSELSILTGCFKRIHCVTFGAPPVTLLPLAKPDVKNFQKSLFFSFINEGDPVVRAEKAYMRSLVDLLSSPLPISSKPDQRMRVTAGTTMTCLQNSMSKLDLTIPKMELTNPCSQAVANRLVNKCSLLGYLQQDTSVKPSAQFQQQLSTRPQPNIWLVPQATLSNAGRLVLMRAPAQPSSSGEKSSSAMQRVTSQRWEKDNLSKVTVHTVTDAQLRNVVFGDPAMHAMEVYLRRVDMLALKAVTARG
ncbi:hypothetical protein LTS08_006387 [Lithohypha guttulata]|nr:hypothetical protein LTS08_006387 [Lithohypha guttulata]